MRLLLFISSTLIISAVKSQILPTPDSISQKLTIGGEARWQYFYLKNEDWGNAVKDKDGYFLQRSLIHAKVNNSGRLKGYIELQSSLINGKANTSPVEENPLELHQAYADIQLLHNKRTSMLLRIGRQELSYGSQRLLSVREIPNNRQAFDGIKISHQSNSTKLDIFYVHYVTAKKGLFDDGSSGQVKLWSVYFVQKDFFKNLNVDLYYFGLYKKQAVFDDGSGEEKRQTLGFRIWGNTKLVNYDAEAVWQYGHLSDKQITAWTVSLNVNKKWSDIKGKPELGLKSELISGNKQYFDGKLETFNPLFPRGAYFGLAAFIGPVNLADIHPSFSFDIYKNLRCNIEYDRFWRFSLQDGIYSPNVSLLYSGSNNPYKLIGSQYSSDIRYSLNPTCSFRAELTWFRPGAYLQKAGAKKDIFFTGLTATYLF